MNRNFGIGPYQSVDWSDIMKGGLGAELEARIPVADIAGAHAARDRKLVALLRHTERTAWIPRPFNPRLRSKSHVEPLGSGLVCFCMGSGEPRVAKDVFVVPGANMIGNLEI